MPFDIELVLLSDPNKPMPPEYYDNFVGNYPDLIDRPLLEVLGERLETFHRKGRSDFEPIFAAAVRTLEHHPSASSLAIEQALKTLREILDKSEALPRATLMIHREGRSALGEPKIRGLTLDDLEFAGQRQEDNLDGDWIDGVDDIEDQSLR